ncbi:hypothetical protein [Streptomyces sp. NPDC006925]|uniref:hypothetical protein n=1 Tax=Streptomyces sp. NPDC006925 TaxID=3364768 RepID=UPI00369A09D9
MQVGPLLAGRTTQFTAGVLDGQFGQHNAVASEFTASAGPSVFEKRAGDGPRIVTDRNFELARAPDGGSATMRRWVLQEHVWTRLLDQAGLTHITTETVPGNDAPRAADTLLVIAHRSS